MKNIVTKISLAAINTLKKGELKFLMATGDNRKGSGKAPVVRQLGLDGYFAEVFLKQQKIIKDLQGLKVNS